MDKITTLNTLKNVFSALGAKTSDDNYAVGLFDKTSGEPKGMMGISDLVSVMVGQNPLRYRSFGLQKNSSLVFPGLGGGLFAVGHPSYGYALVYVLPTGSSTSIAPANKDILTAYGVSFSVQLIDGTYTLTVTRNATGGSEAGGTLSFVLLA